MKPRSRSAQVYFYSRYHDAVGVLMSSCSFFFVLFFSCNLHAEKVDLSLPFPAVFISQRQWLVALDSSTLPVVQVSTRRHRTSTSIPGVPVWKCLIPG